MCLKRLLYVENLWECVSLPTQPQLANIPCLRLASQYPCFLVYCTTSISNMHNMLALKQVPASGYVAGKAQGHYEEPRCTRSFSDGTVGAQPSGANDHPGGSASMGAGAARHPRGGIEGLKLRIFGVG
jgi:hypothetical protein